MVKMFYSIMILLFLIGHKGMCSISEPHLFICYSENKEYKLVVSPSYCNENTCLTLDEIDSLGNKIDKEFLSQMLFIYKKTNGKYLKMISYLVPKEQKYLEVPHARYFISNDGKTVVMEDRLNIVWNIFKLESGGYFQLQELRGENLFDLKQKEYERCLEEIHGYTEKFFGCKVWTKVKNSLKIRIRYFSIVQSKYIYKKIEIQFE